MQTKYLKYNAVLLSLLLSACDNGKTPTPSDSDDQNNNTSQILSGTAATGAPIIGTVTAKGSQGNTSSPATIEADGSFNLDVSSLTAPYKLRAHGHVGGQEITLHSYTDESGTINITPFTDLIIANAAGQAAAAFYQDDTNTRISEEDIATQEAALEAQLQDVFAAVGIEGAVDLLNASFNADKTGLDAALELIEYSQANDDSSTATLNIVDEFNNIIATLRDDVSDANDTVIEDGDEGELVLSENEMDTLGGYTNNLALIDDLFVDFNNLFDDQVPSSSQLQTLLSSRFLHRDQDASAFSLEVSTDSSVRGISFTPPIIQSLENNEAEVRFYVVENGTIDPESENWLLHFENNQWKLSGDQAPVDFDEVNYHCNDYNGFDDDNTAGCGINTRVEDTDFSNTSGLPAAAATVSLYSSTDSEFSNAKATIYLGNPSDKFAGELDIYNRDNDNGFFTGDWIGFGSGINQINPSLIEVGDQVVYRVWTDELDLSDPMNPLAPSTSPVYQKIEQVDYTPVTTARLPSISQTTKQAIGNFELGESLSLSWTPQSGQTTDEVLIEFSADDFSAELWKDGLSGDTTSLTVSAAEINALQVPTDYDLLVRIYVQDEPSRQNHSVTLRKSDYTGSDSDDNSNNDDNNDSDNDDSDNDDSDNENNSDNNTNDDSDSSSLVGSWDLGLDGSGDFDKTIITFTDQGEFFFFNLASDDDDECRQTGYEYGTYERIGNDIELESLIDTNGCVGIFDSTDNETDATFTITAEGLSSLTAYLQETEEEKQSFTWQRMLSSTEGIAGAWHEIYDNGEGNASNLLLLLENGHIYAMDADENNLNENDFFYGEYIYSGSTFSRTWIFEGFDDQNFTENTSTNVVEGRLVFSEDDSLGRLLPESMASDSLAFTTTELENGFATYLPLYWAEDCGNRWVVEDFIFNDNGYTLNECGDNEGNEVDETFQVLDSGIVKLVDHEEYVKRMSFNSDMQAYLICWEDTELAASACPSANQGYAFLSKADAQAYAQTQAALSNINLTEYRITSTISNLHCPNAVMGWDYIFTEDSVTFSGTDGTSGNCNVNPEETFIDPVLDIIDYEGFFFHCENYPICTLAELNREYDGTDFDGDEAATITISHQAGSNTITVIQDEDVGETWTEVLTLTQISNEPLLSFDISGSFTQHNDGGFAAIENANDTFKLAGNLAFEALSSSPGDEGVYYEVPGDISLVIGDGSHLAGLFEMHSIGVVNSNDTSDDMISLHGSGLIKGRQLDVYVDLFYPADTFSDNSLPTSLDDLNPTSIETWLWEQDTLSAEDIGEMEGVSLDLSIH